MSDVSMAQSVSSVDVSPGSTPPITQGPHMARSTSLAPKRRPRAATGGGRPLQTLLPLLLLLLLLKLGLLAVVVDAFFVAGPATISSSRIRTCHPPPPHLLGRRRAVAAASASAPAPGEDYVLSGPTSDDERVFTMPPTVTTPMPLREAVEVYGQFSSPSKARKLIRRGQVWVNGVSCNAMAFTVAGDQIEIRAVEPRVKRKDGKPRGVKKIRVVFEDDDLAVIVKPAGTVFENVWCMCVHVLAYLPAVYLRLSDGPPACPQPTPRPQPTPMSGVAVHGTGAYSLVDRYAEFLTPTTRSEGEALPKPVHAHRLDAPVGGLLIVAKSLPALRGLAAAFEARRVHKRYRAVVMGHPPADEGAIADPIDGKEARTRYALVNCTASADFGRLSQLDLFPETGRKHQLRVHCAQGLGTPILGDLRYGPNETLRTRGLFLFSFGLAFDHPVTGERLELEAELPEIYSNTVNMERKKAEGVVMAAAAAATGAGRAEEEEEEEGEEEEEDEDEGDERGGTAPSMYRS